jgi:drug/metabolite transporter (DMT)-like permease
MIAISFGLLAAFCWASHDLFARILAERTGPYRMAFYVMLTGAVLLACFILWRGEIWQADLRSVQLALINGVIYAGAVSTLFLAFSLAPVSIVGPFTAGYPALVVIWGLTQGHAPTPLQWLGVVLIIVGAIVVGRSRHDDGGSAMIAKGKLPVVVIACLAACLFFSATVVVGQMATEKMGSFETTFISRFPGALVLLPFMLRDRHKLGPLPAGAWKGLFAMGAFDVVALTGVNVSTHYPGKELGAMAISCYGALAVLMAMIILKEKVSFGQWCGIGLTVVGIILLGVPQ